MVRKTDTELKNIIQEIGILIDARFKLFETNLKAYIKSEITASEERTDKKLKAIESKMATKEDIKDMATKQDIKDMATKQDIKNMATKQDIKNMATKQDITRLETKIDKNNVLIQTQINNLDKRMNKVEIKLINAETKN